MKDPAVSAGLLTAWLVALIATLGSLYFSEVRGFVPCSLCWYQRTLMYPLVVVLGVAAFRGERAGWWYALPLAWAGAAVAAYHVLIQKVPSIAGPGGCAVGVPCSGAYVNYLGFISIPVLALTAFVIIGVLGLTGLMRRMPS